MKPTIINNFKATIKSWIRAAARTPTVCSSAATTTQPIANERGGNAIEGSIGSRYCSKPNAATAIAPVNPASNDTHPAIKPATGCHVRERKRYSPPDWVKREASDA